MKYKKKEQQQQQPPPHLLSPMLLSASTLINRLRPTKSLLAVGRHRGLAVSDPYLSCAMPLASRSISSDLLEEYGVGGIVFLVPPAKGYQDIVSRLSAEVLSTQWTATLTRAQAREYAQHDLLWDEIELPTNDDLNIEPNIEAAIGLQQFLFTHCGGWSNTFG